MTTTLNAELWILQGFSSELTSQTWLSLSLITGDFRDLKAQESCSDALSRFQLGNKSCSTTTEAAGTCAVISREAQTHTQSSRGPHSLKSSSPDMVSLHWLWGREYGKSEMHQYWRLSGASGAFYKLFFPQVSINDAYQLDNQIFTFWSYIHKKIQ